MTMMSWRGWKSKPPPNVKLNLQIEPTWTRRLIVDGADEMGHVIAARKESWLELALAPLSRLRAAVLGDYCLDAYWQLDSDELELSLETGLPARRVRSWQTLQLRLQ
jgi:hypothetical protein